MNWEAVGAGDDIEPILFTGCDSAAPTHDTSTGSVHDVATADGRSSGDTGSEGQGERADHASTPWTSSPADAPSGPGLNPTQQRTLDDLRADPTERPLFRQGLAADLRSTLEDGLAPAAATLRADRALRVDKRLLEQVHGCEVRFLAERDAPFHPSVPVVRGTVVHKAVELGVNWRGTPLPGALVDAAVERLAASDHWAGDFLAILDDSDRAQLRSDTIQVVAGFLECWPPLDVAMRPATEVKLSQQLCDGKIVLNGRIDLSLGQPIGSGTQARKIVVDFKTGGPAPTHREDLRFYALVETLRTGVPPRLLVSAYLDAGRNDIEAVTEGHLFAAAARVVDGVGRYAELRTGEAEPTLRPAIACRWCPLLEGCDAGRRFLEDLDPFG